MAKCLNGLSSFWCEGYQRREVFCIDEDLDLSIEKGDPQKVGYWNLENLHLLLTNPDV